MDVAAWLQGLGLERYVPAFLENRIEADILPSLTVEDLKDLGVTLVGESPAVARRHCRARRRGFCHRRDGGAL